jgi:putative oligomerization/nucleic acid binding protein
MRARRWGVGAILVLATIVATITIFAVWAQRQVADTDNWTDTTTQLLENEKVRDALGTYLVQELFAAAPIEDSLRTALPPQLQPLAGPAAAGLRQVAQRNAPRVLGSAAALNAWTKANRRGHVLLLKILRSERTANGEVTLDLGGLATQIADSTGLPPSAVQKLPPNVAELTVLKSSQLDAAQTGFDVLEELPLVLGILLVALFAAAIGLSPDRRRTVLSCGLCLVIAAIAVLALRRLGESLVVGALADAPNAHAAAPEVWAIATSLLVAAASGTLLLGVLIVVGAWFTGPGRRAVALRRWATPTFRDRPALVHGILAALLLLLVWWGPVPWTRNVWALLVVAIIAFAWLEWLRRRTVEEFPDAEAGQWAPPWRRALQARRLERLDRLHAGGILTQEEFEREKAALI